MQYLQSLHRRMSFSKRRDRNLHFARPCITSSLPFELLEDICTLACTDGVYTGCSLSRVSKTIRKASRSGRFTTVVLQSSSANQLYRFLAFYKQERARAAADGTSQPKVRHLFLASARRVRALHYPPPFDQDLELQDFQQDVDTLIELVASDLHVLFLLQGHYPAQDALSLPKVGLASFPLLYELHLIGGGCDFAPASFRFKDLDRAFEDASMSEQSVSSHPQLPSLTHLHLSCDVNSSSFDMHMGMWSHRSPGLTHLRLTNLSQNPGLQDIVLCRGETGRLFKNLQLLVVQPLPIPEQAGWGGTAMIDYLMFAAELAELHTSPPCLTRRWALLPSTEGMSVKAWAKAAAREWSDWLQGRSGCWAVDEKYFNSGDLVARN